MSQPLEEKAESFPYATHLNILFPHLEKVDVSALAQSVKDQWYNQTLCQVNGSVVRLGVMQGEYHWHKHDDDDEFFFCLDGEFLVDLEDRTITLEPQQGVVVPKGVLHRTRAPEKCIILMVENAGIVPTGTNLAERPILRFERRWRQNSYERRDAPPIGCSFFVAM